MRSGRPGGRPLQRATYISYDVNLFIKKTVALRRNAKPLSQPHDEKSLFEYFKVYKFLNCLSA